MVQVVEIAPHRPDQTPDGLYDVHVSGNLAYVTEMLSDQEDKPSQSLVQILDLARVGVSGVDASVPVMVQRNATVDNFAVRGVTLARGAIQVAAGKGGIGRIDLPALTVLQHSPQVGETDISTQLDQVLIELSAVLPSDTVLSNYVQVLEGDAQIGRDVTAQFDLSFAARGTDTTKRRIQLVRKDGQNLLPRTRYYVRIKQGLKPVTGQALASDYVFSFSTASADALYPDIVSICTRESAERNGCVNVGDVRGGTQVVVRGTNFGEQPRLSVGGEPLVVDSRVKDADTGIVTLYAKTVPNYPGPAAVTVTTDAGLSDTVLGGFVFVDELSISHLTPAVVRVAQSGKNDRVDLVGKGFHAGMTLTAYKSGEPGTAKTFKVGSDDLRLYSAERMSLLVPDLRDDEGGGYRGFIDIELADDLGRHYVQRNALFYGRLQLDRSLESEPPMTMEEIDARLKTLADGQLTSYVPDPLKLPPGNIVDLAADSELHMLYVLGRGELRGPAPSALLNLEQLQHYYAPGWISLVKYDPAKLAEAAPRHGLGYYNLPQDLQPSAMALAEKQLYVTARGYDFPYLDTEYEGRSVLLVYDREIRDPDVVTEQPPGKDRGVRYSLPLPYNTVAEKVLAHQGLLLINAGTEGVVVVSVAEPLRPSVVRRLTSATVDGRTLTLNNVSDISVIGDTLHVVNGGNRVLFDLSKPSLPQLGDSRVVGLTGLTADGSQFVTGNGLNLYDASRPAFIREQGRYLSGGFSVPGDSKGMRAQASTALNLTQTSSDRSDCEKADIAYLGFYDFSRADNISLLDALGLPYCVKEAAGGLLRKSARSAPMVLTDQGIGAVSLQTKLGEEVISNLGLVDLLTLELVRSTPADQADGVPLDSPLTLQFTRPLTAMDDEQLRQFLVLQHDAQNNQPASELPFSLQRSADQRVLTVQPSQGLQANHSYRIVLKGDLASRRSRGLLEHAIRFRAGVAGGAQVQIVSTAPGMLDVGGGDLDVVLRGASGQVQFSVSGQAATGSLAETLVDGTSRYRIQAPASLPGAASLQVVSGNGSKASKVGAVQFVEPLLLRSLTPALGSACRSKARVSAVKPAL